MYNIRRYLKSWFARHPLLFLWIFMPVLLSGASMAQSLSVVSYGINEGLPQTNIISIAQGAQGFMWFGSQDGLIRFDGNEFKVFKPDPNNPNAISSNTISTLMVDREGNLWVGTYVGLNKYDYRNGRFTVYKHEENNPNSLSHNDVRSIIEDNEGNLWVATQGGLNRLDKDRLSFTQFIHDPDKMNSINNNAVNVVFQDSEGIIWVGTNRGLDKFDYRSGRFVHINQNEPALMGAAIVAIVEDERKQLWVGTDNSGLFVYGKYRKKLSHYIHDSNKKGIISSNLISSLYNDSQDRLWVGTLGSGLNILDKESGQFVVYQDDPYNPNGLESHIYSVFEDNMGVFWVGTGSRGVAKINPTNFALTRVSNRKTFNNVSPQSNLRSFLLDKQGVLWTGSDGDAIKLKYPDGSEENYRLNTKRDDSLGGNEVFSILEDKNGTVWVGSERGRLNRYNRKTKTFVRYESQPKEPNSLLHGRVRELLEDSKGLLWVGLEKGGVHIFDRNRERFQHYHYDPNDSNSLASNRIYSMLEDRSGNIWVATFGGGLNMFDRKTGNFIRYTHHDGVSNSISYDYIVVIHEDNIQDVLWLGTNGAGLDRFDLKTGTFTNYNEQHGLPNNVVYGILQDDQNNLWLTSNQGLTRFDPNKITFKNYDVRDGLQSNEFNGGAYYQAPDGKFYLGGIDGYNVFYPEDIVDNPHKPLVYITEFQLFNKSIEVDEIYNKRVLLDKPVTVLDKLTLSYKDYVFSLKFAALDYVLPAKNQYAFKMEGLENDWNYVGNRRFATYTTLPPGDYTFRVKASNNDGVWNDEGVSLPITITPPVWLTWWFRLLMILLILLIVFTLYRVRIRSINARNKMLEKEVEIRTSDLNKQKQNLELALTELNETKNAFEESSQVATGVLHNVGNLLNSINTSAGLIRRKLHDTAIKKYLKANNKLRNNLIQIGEIVSEEDDAKKMLNYYLGIEKYITDDQGELKENIERLIDKLTTMKQTVVAQQRSAKGVGFIETLSLETLINKTIEMQSESDDWWGIQFEKKYKPLPDIKIEKAKLIQVMLNLFVNAKESMEEASSENKTITIEIDKDDINAYIKVSDTGLGIEPVKIKKMFSYGYTTKSDGHGFGLHSCANYLQSMGGRISVVSEGLGKGATFVLQIPLRGVLLDQGFSDELALDKTVPPAVVNG